MKRFATYLYTYIDKEKTQNIGFIKVEVNGKHIKLMIRIVNNMEERLCGEKDVFLVLNKDKAVNLGKMQLSKNGAKQFFEQDLSNCYEQDETSNQTADDLYGIKIGVGNDFFASCWTDDGEFVVSFEKNKDDKNRDEKNRDKEKQIANNIIAQEEQGIKEKKPWKESEETEFRFAHNKIVEQSRRNCTTKKIDLEDLKNYPAKNWYLSHNSFLMHGYATYDHLLIKTDEKGQSYLGVPAVSEPSERIMAQIYGFDKFEPAVPTSEDEAESGVFGYFFCKLM